MLWEAPYPSIIKSHVGLANNMSFQSLAVVLNSVGNMLSRETDYTSQAYGMVYNELYSIYTRKLSSLRRY